jgi:hypothetical protein
VTSAGRGGIFVLAFGAWLFTSPGLATAQLFDGPIVPRPPGEVPGPPPAANLLAPGPALRGDRIAPPAGPILQSLPPPSASPPSAPAQIAPAIPL